MMTNEHIMVNNNLFEKVKTFEYLDFILTNQNVFHEEIKYGLKAAHSCYFSFQTPLSSRHLSKNLKYIGIYTIILPVVLIWL